jgi:hypothetical protein
MRSDIAMTNEWQDATVKRHESSLDKFEQRLDPFWQEELESIVHAISRDIEDNIADQFHLIAIVDRPIDRIRRNERISSVLLGVEHNTEFQFRHSHPNNLLSLGMSGSSGISKILVDASRTPRNKTCGRFWNSPSVCEHEQGNHGSSETSGKTTKCEPHEIENFLCPITLRTLP